MSPIPPDKKSGSSSFWAKGRRSVFPRSTGGQARRLAILLGLVLLGPACTSIEGELRPGAQPPSPPGENYRIGAYKVDITPVPGYPMGGFSIGGQIGRGVWHRLFARAIYIEDKKGTELVFVSCDLPFLPGGLGDRVADLIQRVPATASLSREQIVLAATHTHHGPGNFLSNPFYNTFGSCDPGYDSVLFDFLADRIAKAIVAAASRPEPALLSYSAKAVGGLSMNRSLPAFLRNPESQEILAGNDKLDLGGTPASCHSIEAYHAIDPTLAVLRAVRASDPKHTIALVSFFSVQPTTLGPTLPLYDSDLFGLTSTLVEQALARDQGAGTDGLAAIFNGAEGDVITTSTRQDREDLEGEGNRLSDAIQALAKAPPAKALSGDLSYRCKLYAFPKKPDPLFGAPVLGGPENGRSFFYDLGWREYLHGNPQHPIPGQGTKLDPQKPLHEPLPTLGAVESLQKEVTTLPKSAWIGVYRLGPDLTIATLPGEFTTTMGRRITRAVEASLGPQAPDAPPRTLFVGLANEYVAYFTAPEEHDAQAYSGASMVYGRDAATKVKDFVVELAKEGPQPRRIETLPYSYAPGVSADFGIERIRLGSIRTLSDLKHLEPFLYSLKDVLFGRKDCTIEVKHPFVHWISEDPAWPPQESLGESPIPDVAIERSQNGCWEGLFVNKTLEDHYGTRLISLAWGLPGAKTAWTFIWLAPRPEVAGGAFLRFRIANAGKIFYSSPFTLDELAQHEDGNVPMRKHAK